jgi:hypothetical protein
LVLEGNFSKNKVLFLIKIRRCHLFLFFIFFGLFKTAILTQIKFEKNRYNLNYLKSKKWKVNLKYYWERKKIWYNKIHIKYKIKTRYQQKVKGDW